MLHSRRRPLPRFHVRQVTIQVASVPRADGEPVVGMCAGPDARVGTPIPIRRVVSRLAAGSRPGAQLVVAVSSSIQELLGQPILVGGQIVVLSARQPAPPAQRAWPGRGSPLVWR